MRIQRIFIILVLGGAILVAINVLISQRISRNRKRPITTESELVPHGTRSNKLEELVKTIDKLNQEQYVLNVDKFNSTTLVHDRLLYLKKLIESLSESVGINGVLLIFSHDVFSNITNSEIRQITFCKVLQIFYPYSIQLYGDVFPGQEKENVYGWNRNANIVQIKHHWWWKINYLFNRIRILKNYQDSVVFLEEDHYVTPDFIYFLQLMKEHAQTTCKQCQLFSLGLQHAVVDFKKYYYKVWVSDHIENLGLTLDRKTAELLLKHAQEFCTYDDSNWDWTLVYILQKFVVPQIFNMSPIAARVYHIGSCGVHTKGRNCDPSAWIESYRASQLLGVLYPLHLKTERLQRKFVMRRNGGWIDPRDHQLCLNVSKNNK